MILKMAEGMSDEYVEIPTINLFKLSDRREAQALSASSNDVPIENSNYAITVNISNTKLVNKKPWHKYTQDEQRRILARVEQSFRKKTPSVVLVRIEYEACPSNNNIHFHALYNMPYTFISTLENHWVKFDSTDKNTLQKWRHLDVRAVKNVQGWLDYISKEKA